MRLLSLLPLRNSSVSVGRIGALLLIFKTRGVEPIAHELSLVECAELGRGRSLCDMSMKTVLMFTEARTKCRVANAQHLCGGFSRRSCSTHQ